MEASTGLIVPLVFRGEELGVIEAFDRMEAGPEFTRVDEDLMLSFAASAATAVHTASSVAQERLERSLEASEHERARWARELHDETLQSLAGLQLALAAAEREQDPEKRGALIGNARAQVNGEIANLRNLITELRPAELDEIGLESALEALATRRAAGDSMDVRVSVELGVDAAAREQRLPAQIESTIYRLVQESLTNVAKHAGASRVDVQVGLVNGSVDIVVSDDGAGFDPDSVAGGWGLVGMRERVALLNGTLDLESKPGAGTKVHASLPSR
jgi:signal transduction histidine kinase